MVTLMLVVTWMSQPQKAVQEGSYIKCWVKLGEVKYKTAPSGHHQRRRILRKRLKGVRQQLEAGPAHGQDSRRGGECPAAVGGRAEPRAQQ